MRRIFLMLFAIMNIMTINADDIIINKNGQNPETGPRTSIPSVCAFMDEGIITVDINRYNGNVNVDIIDSAGQSIIVDQQFINGHTSFTLDCNTLATDTYSIVITLDDGAEYSGVFSI